MNPPPKVSIVLPTHDGRRFLSQAIESCLAQTWTDWELIIVDDASTDDTPEIVARYVAADPRIRGVRHLTNRKLPAALNTGFTHARGQYYTWISDDNCFRPQALATLVAALDSNVEVDVIYADYTEIDEQGQPLRYVAVGEPIQLGRGNCVKACFLYRRLVHERLGGYMDDLFLIEDYDFWLRASVFFRLCALHCDLYLYRRHPGALTSRRKRDIALAAEKALKRNLPRMTWLGNEMLSHCYGDLAELAIRNSGRGAAIGPLWMAIRHSPLVGLRETVGLWMNCWPSGRYCAPFIRRLHKYLTTTLLRRRGEDFAG